ncbi:MAG: MarR family transcriptional regulator [Chloroflexi bacterium]|jgi:DNA-binding MarR family transcriptional regulator|nr:MarR family transcriptional regulator [Anaerolineaceae bacterium]NMB89073.1 MarR family transcriptional regulator [Chloroflexota bacterium]
MAADLPRQCARELLEVVPVIMQAIRAEMRRQGGGELSVPQLRSLIFLSNYPGASLTDLAEVLGLTTPSAFAIIKALLSKDLVTREESPVDRRRVSLRLTEQGEAILNRARGNTQDCIVQRLDSLSEPELTTIYAAFEHLRTVFVQ